MPRGICILPLAEHGRWGTRLEVKSVKTETPAIVETEPGVDGGVVNGTRLAVDESAQVGDLLFIGVKA